MQKKILLVLISILFLGVNTTKACTIFSCSRGGEVFAAANEDDTTPFTRIWYNPATKDRYGSVCFGGPDMQVASAMNEHGLFLDFAAANYDISKLKQLNPYKGFLMWEVLGKCKNVKEAIAIIKKYDYNSPSQVLLADKEGNSVLINPERIIEKKGDFQVNANCNSINGKLSCRRPEIVNEELSASKNISVDFFKSILNKTHQEGELTTLYSTVCDLKRGIIYVYLFHDYDHVYTIDLKTELKKGYRIENLADQFSTSFAYESFSKNHSLYVKESILQEMKTKGTDITIDYYLAESSKQLSQNKNLDSALLEVALQLVKYSWNDHTNGGMWDYWFSFPKGYEIEQYQDPKLESAEKILKYLSEKENQELKLKNFIYEMYGYVNLVQGDHKTAKEYYNKSVSSPEEAYKVTLLRGKEMLSRIR